MARWPASTTPPPGPYLPIDMTGKDAVFLSPHKFAGGPGTPGVLVAKRALLRTRCPWCRAVGRSCSSPRAGTPTTPIPRSARRAGRRRSSSRSGPGWRSPSRRRSARTRSAAARPTSPGARCDRGARTRASRSSATRGRAAADPLVQPPPPAGPAARELRHRRAQRPVRHPGAQRLLLRRSVHPPRLSDRRRVVAADGGRGGRGHLARSWR